MEKMFKFMLVAIAMLMFSTLSTKAQEKRVVVNQCMGYVAESKPIYLPSNTNINSNFTASWGLNATAQVSAIPGAVIPDAKLSATGSVGGGYKVEKSGIKVLSIEIPRGADVVYYKETNRGGIPSKGLTYVSALQANVPTSLNSNLKYTYEGNNAVYVLCSYVHKSSLGTVWVYIDRNNLCDPKVNNCTGTPPPPQQPTVTISVQSNGNGTIRVGGTYSNADYITIDVLNKTTGTKISAQAVNVSNGQWYYNKPVEAGKTYKFAVRAWNKSGKEIWSEKDNVVAVR